MHYKFNNKYIKAMETWTKFIKHKKKNIFNINDYEFIHKTY